jgi:nitrogen-specific signal transduction histidine kinase
VVIVSGDPDALLDPSEQLEALTEPCVSSSSGVLLRLASRIATAHGGTLNVDLAPEGRLRLSLAVPATGHADPPSQT